MNQNKINNIHFKINLIGFFLIIIIIIILIFNPTPKDYFCHCSNHNTMSGLPAKELGSLGSPLYETPGLENTKKPLFFAVGI